MRFSSKSEGGGSRGARRTALDYLKGRLPPKALKPEFQYQSHVNEVIWAQNQYLAFRRQLRRTSKQQVDERRMLKENMGRMLNRRNELIELINGFLGGKVISPNKKNIKVKKAELRRSKAEIEAAKSRLAGEFMRGPERFRTLTEPALMQAAMDLAGMEVGLSLLRKRAKKGK